MKPSWIITAFAFAITIATHGSYGPPTGCNAAVVPDAISGLELSDLIHAVLPSGGRESPLVTAIGNTVGANLTAISEQVISRLSGPLRSLSVTILNLVRSILSAIDAPIRRWMGSAQETLDRVEDLLRGSNEINGDTTESTRHRRHTRSTIDDSCDYWINQAQLFIERLQEILVNAAKQIIASPELLINAAASLSNTITHPIENLSNLGNLFKQLSLNSFNTAKNQTLLIAGKFLTTQLIPFLHKLLNEMDQTKLLPPTLHEGVTTFNTIYTVLKMLGYVS
ncbi:uncharacterized protein LOC144471266 [Augochlora pura]